MSERDYIEYAGRRVEGWGARLLLIGVVAAIFLSGVAVGNLIP